MDVFKERTRSNLIKWMLNMSLMAKQQAGVASTPVVNRGARCFVTFMIFTGESNVI